MSENKPFVFTDKTTIEIDKRPDVDFCIQVILSDFDGGKEFAQRMFFKDTGALRGVCMSIIKAIECEAGLPPLVD